MALKNDYLTTELKNSSLVLKIKKEYDSSEKKEGLPTVIKRYIDSLEQQNSLLYKLNETLIGKLEKESSPEVQLLISEVESALHDCDALEDKFNNLVVPIKEDILPYYNRAVVGRKKGGSSRSKYQPYEQIIISVLEDYFSLDDIDRPKIGTLPSTIVKKIHGNQTKQTAPDSKTISKWMKLFLENNRKYLWTKPLD